MLHFSLARLVGIVENFARGIFLHYSSFSGKSSGLIKMRAYVMAAMLTRYLQM